MGNNRVKPLEDSINVLIQNDKYDSDKAKALYNELRESKSQDKNIVIYKKLDDLRKRNQHLSSKAKKIEAKLNPIYIEQEKYQEEYISSNSTIVAYSFFLQNLIYNKEKVDVSLAKKTIKIFPRLILIINITN